MNVKQISDRAYKYIFSNPSIFLQLLKHFVHEDFVKDIAPGQLERVDKEFISDEFIKRESDIVYKITGENRDIYVFVLMEFQSCRDRRFPVRMLNYISQFYDIQSRQKQVRDKLPNIFPLLLYSGKHRWDIPFSFQELVKHDIPDKYIPHMTYYPVLLNEIPEDKLFAVKSTISAVIYLEQAGNSKELERHITRLAEMLVDEDIINKEYFGRWANMLFSPEREIDIAPDYTVYSKRGVDPMLAEMPALLRKEGKKEGLKEGKAEGMLVDKQIILKRLLDRKFGISRNTAIMIDHCTDPVKLDKALDEFVFACDAQQVLKHLQ